MGAPDEFHPDAHPEAKEITGDRRYGEWGQCIATAKSHGGRCGGYAQGPHGKCNRHGGAEGSGAPEGNTNAEGNDGGAPEENVNAVSHGAYADEHAFYSKVASEGEKQVIDDVFVSYLERYRARHGEPDYGDRVELFFCAVTIGKEIHGENWAVDRPDDLDSGNALVASETNYTDDGTEYTKYKRTVIQQASKALSNRRRHWLKDMSLLESPEEHMAQNTSDLASIIADDAAN